MLNESFHILVIEDNPADSHLITKIFKERCPGVEVSVVSDGASGSDFIFRRGSFTSAPTPQLILLDLNLPGKDGREVLREVKAEPGFRGVPILMFTSSEAETDIRACYEVGANAYFAKPSDLDEFVSLIEVIYEHWIKRVKLPPQLMTPSSLVSARGSVNINSAP